MKRYLCVIVAVLMLTLSVCGRENTKAYDNDELELALDTTYALSGYLGKEMMCEEYHWRKGGLTSIMALSLIKYENNVFEIWLSPSSHRPSENETLAMTFEDMMAGMRHLLSRTSQRDALSRFYRISIDPLGLSDETIALNKKYEASLYGTFDERLFRKICTESRLLAVLNDMLISVEREIEGWNYGHVMVESMTRDEYIRMAHYTGDADTLPQRFVVSDHLELSISPKINNVVDSIPLKEKTALWYKNARPDTLRCGDGIALVCDSVFRPYTRCCGEDLRQMINEVYGYRRDGEKMPTRLVVSSDKDGRAQTLLFEDDYAAPSSPALPTLTYEERMRGLHAMLMMLRVHRDLTHMGAISIDAFTLEEEIVRVNKVMEKKKMKVKRPKNDDEWEDDGEAFCRILERGDMVAKLKEWMPGRVIEIINPRMEGRVSTLTRHDFVRKYSYKGDEDSLPEMMVGYDDMTVSLEKK